MIYKTKPNMKNGVTWSESEYRHLGFLYHYVRLKSIQRFTETYNLMCRALDKNLFNFVNTKKKVRIISLGGGPGFELYASRLFFENFFPDTEIEYVTLELSSRWKMPNKVLRNKYIERSFYDEDIYENVVPKFDIVIMAYTYYHYFYKKNINILSKLFKKRNKLLLINSRVRTLKFKQNKLLTMYNLTRTSTQQIAFVKHEPIILPFRNVPYE